MSDEPELMMNSWPVSAFSGRLSPTAAKRGSRHVPVQAVGSVGAGYINVPHAIGGSTELERFLEPNLGAGELLTAATESSASGADEVVPLQIGGTERRRRARPV